MAALFGADVSNAKTADAGRIIADALRRFLGDLNVPNGIKALGYGSGDIERLVQGALPQHRVIKLAPREATAEALASILENALTMY